MKFLERSIKTELGSQPRICNTDFSASRKELTSIEGAPSVISGSFFGHKNKFTSLHNIHKQIKFIGVTAHFNFNPIKSHALGLLLIDGLQKVFLDNKEVQNIINKHLKGDKDVFACQEELIENGLDEFAQL